MNQRRSRKKIWICADVWMDILPFFERVKIGLILAMVSDRLDALVDTHFDGKSELTISNWTMISKDKGLKPKLSVCIDDKFVAFPFPDRPLPNKIRFNDLQIEYTINHILYFFSYIDHSVIEFLRSNKQIWDRSGTELELDVSKKTEDNHPIWAVFARQIWPIFAPNIRYFACFVHLDKLRRLISPTLLTDLDQLISIDSYNLFPDAITDFNGPNATVGQALSKWLHTPSKNGRPKRLFCGSFIGNFDWIDGFKETFLRATASVSYQIRIGICMLIKPIEPFKLFNERTKEMLTLEEILQILGNSWLLKRCPISEKAAIQWENDENWDDNLNNVHITLCGGKTSTGPSCRPQRKKKNKKKKKQAKALKRRRTARK